MNTSAQALVFAVVSVATAAAIGTGLADWTERSAPEVAQLERVVVVGKHVDTQAPTEFVQLPRVVVEGHRAVTSEAVQVASADKAAASI
ncbi:hypothetical protein ACFJGW_08240 [Burkholderiaceae bacterium UC74_6]